MPSYNSLIIIGHLTRDVELKYTPSGKAIAEFGVAQNRKWKDSTGKVSESVLFLSVKAWAKTAEWAARDCRKGDAVALIGRLEYEQWEDAKSKEKRSRHVMIAEQVNRIDYNKEASNESSPAPQQAKTSAEAEGDSVPF